MTQSGTNPADPGSGPLERLAYQASTGQGGPASILADVAVLLWEANRDTQHDRRRRPTLEHARRRLVEAIRVQRTDEPVTQLQLRLARALDEPPAVNAGHRTILVAAAYHGRAELGITPEESCTLFLHVPGARNAIRVMVVNLTNGEVWSQVVNYGLPGWVADYQVTGGERKGPEE